MRLEAIYIHNTGPIKKFETGDLSDIVVIGGRNGVGKTTLINSIIAQLQHSAPQPNVRLTIRATNKAEEVAWGISVLDSSDNAQHKLIRDVLRKPRRRDDWSSTALLFDSDRSFQQVEKFNFDWSFFKDPLSENVGWTTGLEKTRGRFSDTTRSIFRMVRSQINTLGVATQNAIRQVAAGSGGSIPQKIELDTSDFSDPVEKFKKAFSSLLAPKVLLDPDVENQQLKYSLDGQSYDLSSLSSGEREVVTIAFDFLLRNPRDSIIFFDEPELHLHPELSYKLFQTLRSLGERNQFVFCTHSAEIITASLDNTVVFIGPQKTEGANQAIKVDRNDSTHEALSELGQSIGIVALGKKIVLIEGTNSSIDRQTYGAILQSFYPDIVPVPSGGKETIVNFDQLIDQVLNRTIWGVQFFMLCDRDSIASHRVASEVVGKSSGRLRVLPRYHIENYFLDESLIAEVFHNLVAEDDWRRDPKRIREKIREIAKQHISYAVALGVSTVVREAVGNVSLMPRNCHAVSVDELFHGLREQRESEFGRITKALDLPHIENETRTRFDSLLQSLDADSNQWKIDIPGRIIFQKFANAAQIDPSMFKTAYIRRTLETKSSAFADVFAIFDAFAKGSA